MTTLPKRRKKEPMKVKERPQVRCASHLRWIRGFECSVANEFCEGRIEAAHVRRNTDGGASVKPSDYWTIPLCSNHHRIQHNRGERAFEKDFGINMREIAQGLAKKSPHRGKWEEQ